MPVAQPVGRMQIRVRRRQGEATVADVELSIFTDDRYIDLEGIVVREPRPGWTTMEIPPLEKWEKPMRWLLPEQRERMQSPEFFQLLQTHVTRKYLALSPAARRPAASNRSQPPGRSRPARLPRPAGDQPSGQAAPETRGLGLHNRYRRACAAVAVRAEIGDNGRSRGHTGGRRHLPAVSPRFAVDQAMAQR